MNDDEIEKLMNKFDITKPEIKDFMHDKRKQEEKEREQRLLDSESY